MAPRVSTWVLAAAAASLACRRQVDLDRAYAEAEALYHRGQLTAAQERTRQALDPRAPAPTDARGWRLRLLGAEVLAERGEAQAARRVLDQPLPDALAGGDLQARREKILGQAAARLRDPAEAARRFEAAARLARAATTPGLPIEIAHRQAALLAEQGQQEEAELRSRAVIDMATAAPEGRRWRAAALITLGALARARGRWAEALTFLEPALAEARGLGAEALASNALADAGLCHSGLGDFARAARLLAEAAAVKERLGMEGALVETLGDLGKTATLAGDPAQAVSEFERALARARPLGPAAAAPWASHLAASHLALERWDAAALSNAEAADLWRAAGHPEELPAVALVEAAIARGRGDRARAERLYQDLLAHLPDRRGLRWVARSALAGLAAELGRNDEAERGFARAFAHLADARADLGGIDPRLTLIDRLRHLSGDRIAWLIRRGRHEEALRVVELARARILAERLGQPARPGRLALADLRLRTRRRGEVLVSTWVTPERSWAWVIRGGQIRMVRLPGGRELARAVDDLRRFLEEERVDARVLETSPAHELADLLVRPLAVPPGSRVVIAPDGPLHGVPFGALVVPGDPPRYWLEQVSVVSTPSLAALAPGADGARAPAPNLLAIGDARALAVVRRHFPASVTTVLEGSRARPEAYLESDPRRFSLVHIAAQALAHPASPLDSNVQVARGASGDRLSLRDLLRRPLPADLVTVPAARSEGPASHAGDALASFAAGLLAGGVRQVVAGLWSAEPAATARVLDQLYAEIAAGADPASALRSSQLRQLRSAGPGQAPFHWAAFQLFLGPGLTREPRLRSSL